MAISIQDKKTLIKFLPYIFFISLLFLFLVPLFGVEVKGSKRWMEIPFLPRFQPIELVKPMFIIFIAKIINNGLTNSIGWNLGRGSRPIHLFDPLISTPTTRVKKRRIIETRNR